MSVQVYSLLDQTEGERKTLFGGYKKGSHIVILPSRALACHKRWKSLSFGEIWNNPIPPFFFIRPPYKKGLQDMDGFLWIDSRTCQNFKILLSARRRSNNYFELSKKKNVLRNIMLSHLPCFTWKFFMIWFHKILQLIFQKQPSCPRNICSEHWRKPPNLTAFLEIFLYLKNNDSLEHM